MVYDEVILPPTTSSSSKTVISTQPNAAYGPIRMSPIITSDNVAYEQRNAGILTDTYNVMIFYNVHFSMYQSVGRRSM